MVFNLLTCINLIGSLMFLLPVIAMIGLVGFAKVHARISKEI